MTRTLAELDAEVTKLRADMGPSGDFQRDGYLDNPVRIRLHEIGLAIDECVAAVEEFGHRLDSLPASSAGSTLDDLKAAGIWVEGGKIGIGRAPLPNIEEQIQIFGQFNAGILYVANLARNNPQYPTVDGKTFDENGKSLPRVVRDQLSGDGGMRRIQNPTPDQGMPQWSDPQRGYVQVGPDSFGDFSFLKLTPDGAGGYIKHDGTQDMVLRINEQRKTVAWESWRPGWTIGLRASLTKIGDTVREWLAPV